MDSVDVSVRGYRTSLGSSASGIFGKKKSRSSLLKCPKLRLMKICFEEIEEMNV